MSWSKNKDWMLAQEKSGKATAAHKAWLKKWRAAGSPSTQAGMSAKPKPAPAKPSTAAADKAAAAKAAADKRKAAEAAAKKKQQEKIKAQAAAEAAKAKKAADAAAKKKAADAAAKKKAAADAAAKKAAAQKAAADKRKAAEASAKKQQQEKIKAQAAAEAAAAKKAAAKPTVSAWEKNKNHMVAQEKAGKATAAQKAWLDKWKASGSPATKEGMNQAPKSTPAAPKSTPAAPKSTPAAPKAPAAPANKPTTGKGAVGADGLTNEERYKKRLEEKKAKAAAKAAKQAELDKDRPEGVSRYLWEKVLNGDSNFNKALVSKNPEISDAIAAAGHGDWVKAIHEQSMDQAANHYMGNGASSADAWNTAQNDWYTQNHGSYTNETVENDSNDDLGFGGSTGAPTNDGYVPSEPPPPVVEEPPPANGGNPGGMFGGITDAVNDNRPPEEVPPPGGAITGPTYQEQLEAAQAAQKAAYEQQLAAQQAQYDQQVAAQQAAYEQRQAAAEAARQAEIDRRNAEALAKKEANNASWASANAAAAGVASSAPTYTKKYGEGSTGVGLLSGVNSVRDNPARTGIPKGVASEPPRTGGARPSGPRTGGARPSGPTAAGPKGGIPHIQQPVVVDDSGMGGVRPLPPGVQPRPLPPGHGGHQPRPRPGEFDPSHDVWPVDHKPKPGGYIPDDTGFFNTEKTTPWADAFLRSKKAAEAPGAVSGMMKKWME
jgi:hypothetical protein